VIELKKGFVLRKKKIYLLLREKRGEVYGFIEKQLKKRYIRLISNGTSVFCRKKG